MALYYEAATPAENNNNNKPAEIIIIIIIIIIITIIATIKIAYEYFVNCGHTNETKVRSSQLCLRFNKLELNKLTCSQRMGIHSSVGGALQR